MLLPKSSVLAATLLAVASHCTASGAHCKDEFHSPPALQRPRFRYWLPDGNVDETTVRRDILEAASVGAGGVEFLGFFQYGGLIFPKPEGTDWSKGAFGNIAYNKLFKTALETHAATGMVMDFPLGPNQGQGVPARPDDQGLQWDLVYSMIDVNLSQTFGSQIPGWGTGKLVSLVSAVVLNATKINFSSPPNPIFPAQDFDYDSLVLKHDSLEDITNMVSSNGTLQHVFAEPPSGSHYRLFAYYEKLSGAYNVRFDTNQTTTIFDYGSFTVDHYSSKGAQVIIDFWEAHILDDEETKTLLATHAQAGWEDSMELDSTVSWTPSMPAKFQARFGYDLRPLLPLIMFGNNVAYAERTKPGNATAITDGPDQGKGTVNDFRLLLAEGYTEYLDTLRNWLHSLPGAKKLRNQPAYGMPMDMRLSIPHTDIPECESLGFDDNVDSYKQFSGAAMLAGHNVISNEMGATELRAFSFAIPDLLWSMARAFAGGVNQMVIHGQSFSGQYVQTTWPGHTPFDMLHADLWSPKRPDWRRGLEQALRYVGRVQHVQQQGVARSDVAVYDKQSFVWQHDHFFAGKDLDDMVENGWSYHYLSPENFDLPGANVQDHVLSPDGPRFQAIVVPSYENLTVEALEHLSTYAQAGLPVVIISGNQGHYPSAEADHSAAVVTDKFAQLKALSNVHVVEESYLTTTLVTLGLKPRVAIVPESGSGINATQPWRATWREDKAAGISYAYVFNDGPASSASIVVQTGSSNVRPYLFDAWKGERTPLLSYTVDGGTVTVPLEMTENQSIIIAFASQHSAALRGLVPDVPDFHATTVPSSVVGHDSNSTNLILHVAASPSSGTVVLSDKREISIPADAAPGAITLSNWQLTVEIWEAPMDMNDSSTDAAKHNTTVSLPTGDDLPSWLEIPQLANASGVGYYTTHFSWPPSSSADIGAYIKFPPALNSITLVVNGHTLAPMDVYDPVADLSEYLRVGEENTVTAIVPSTMWNYIRTLRDEVVSAGRRPIFVESPLLPTPGVTDNGLVGRVKIVPYARIVV